MASPGFSQCILEYCVIFSLIEGPASTVICSEMSLPSGSGNSADILENTDEFVANAPPVATKIAKLASLILYHFILINLKEITRALFLNVGIFQLTLFDFISSIRRAINESIVKAKLNQKCVSQLIWERIPPQLQGME